MKRGQARVQVGCGCPTLIAIVSLTLRDGGLGAARKADEERLCHGK